MFSLGDCFAFGEKAHAWAKANALPVFDKVELGGIPPEAIAITGDIGALLTGDLIRVIIRAL